MGLWFRPRFETSVSASISKSCEWGSNLKELLSEISETFINLSPELVDGAIENCLKRLVEEFDIDRATLTEVDITTESLIATHRWDRPGIPPDAGNIVKDRFPWLFDHIRKGQIICVPRPEELPDEAVVELEFMRSTGMKSTLVIPLLIGGKPAGAIVDCQPPASIKPGTLS